MEMNLSMKSELNMEYIPKYLKIGYKEEGKEYDLILDIRGDIDCEDNVFHCDGCLVPWILRDIERDVEADLFSLSDSIFPEEKIIYALKNAFKYIVGVSLFADSNSEDCINLDEEDFSGCFASVEMEGCTVVFGFETEAAF